jgi:tetratricopeptide (TPR) repeat protein
MTSTTSSGEAFRRRLVRPFWTWTAVALATLGAAWGAWWWLRPRPALDDAAPLAEAGRFDEAEAKVRAYLAEHPGSDAAHLLLAQVVLGRPDPPSTPADRRTPGPARVALEHLDRVRPRNPRMAVALQLSRGKAFYRLLRLEDAEAAWLEALRLDATAPEAGWSLLDLYYLQGREQEARRLALRLYWVEPDPHDRVQLLLELVRQDARPPAPGSLVNWFEPVVRQYPGDLHSAAALGLALVRAGKVEKGIDQLRCAVESHPDRVEAWDALLTGLDESGQVDVVEDELERLPPSLAAATGLSKHRARVAQNIDWAEAVRLYRQAREAEPYNRVVEYRLNRALRHVGESAEAERIEQRLRRRDIAMQEVRPLYDEATRPPDLASVHRTDLILRIADVRERMQLPDEARAWHQLVLRGDPENAVSLAALARLGAPGGSR